MADVVIIVGTKRGNERISPAEIKQMCVSEDTLVFIAGKRKFSTRAGDIRTGDAVVGIDKKFNTVNGNVCSVFKRVGHAKKIVLNNGSELVGNNHPVALWDGGWTSSDALKIGDKVCVVSSSTYQEGCVSLREKIREILVKTDGIYCRVVGADLENLKKMKTKHIASVCGIEGKSVSKTKKTGIVPCKAALEFGFVPRFLRSKNGSELDLDALRYEDLPWLLGMIATDGNVKYTKTNSGFRLSQRNKDIVDRFAMICRLSGFDGANVRRKKPCKRRNGGIIGEMWECEVCSFPFVKILIALGITPKKTRNLDLSEFIDLKIKDKVNFLSGVIDGDGSFSYNPCSIRICTASRTSAFNLRDMFLSSGIYSGVIKKKGNGSVFGYSCDTEHYIVTIGRKRDVARFRKECSFSVKIPEGIRTDKESRPLRGNCFFSRVRRIEDVGLTNLVNFSVSGCETFVCDGIVTHNCGRAGRKHGGEACVAYILSDEDDTDVLASLENDEGYKVISSFGIPEKVSFHLLPEICSGRTNSLVDAERWYSRSLAFMQGNRVNIETVIKHLVESDAITYNFEPTFLGKISASLYFHPVDVKAWWNNFGEIFEMGLEKDDSAIAWALGNIPMTKIQGDFGANRDVMTSCRNSIPSSLCVSKGCITTITLWWAALGIISSGKMKNQMLGLKNDISRVVQALILIDREEAHWNKESFFKELVWRIKRGIPRSLVELCRMDGMTKGMAVFLESQGIHNKEELRRNLHNLTSEIGENEINILKDVAYGIHGKSD